VVVLPQLRDRILPISQSAILNSPAAVDVGSGTPSTLITHVTVPPPWSWALIA
jgi:hypothetical protein